MVSRISLLASAALAALAATSANAQVAASGAGGGADPQTEADIVVTGLRATLANAANIKRDSNQIQDSIVAEDIGKLPDTNIAETLQRIPGVQIARNSRGEGNGYVVHGLKQVMTTINGRQLFTNTGRTATLLDFSSDILSGLDVYKTATADQIEGGLGGLINIRTARPFDFKGFHFALTGSAAYSDFQDKASPRVSGVVSDRFDSGIGEIGVLVGGQYERFYSAGYQVSTNVYGNTNNLYDRDGDGVFPNDSGDAVTVPTQFRPRYETGNRVRSTMYAALQWQPSPELEIHADAMRSHSGGHSFTQQLSIQIDGATRGVPGSFVYKDAPNGNVPDSFGLTNALVRSVTGASDNPYDTTSLGLGFNWKSGRFSLAGEAAYIDSSGPFYSRSIAIQTRAPGATVDLSGATPDASVSGVDVANPASYAATATYSDLGQQSLGREPSFRLDAKYEFANSPLTALLVGGRWARHRAVNDVYSVSSTVTLTQPLANVGELTPGNLFTDQNASINQWLAIASPFIKDATRTRVLAGISIDDPVYPLGNHFNYLETVWAGYAQAQFGFDLGVPIDGNVGIRYVSTKNHQRVFDAAGQPVEGSATYDNWLPSVNVRAKFTDNLFLRLAYSKAITRPDFGNLSPALVLNAVNFTGSGGNPNLQPTKADQYDASLEYYFGKSNYAAVALFQKDVTGFIQKFSVTETIDGQDYQISRPRNTGSGTIKGFELTYQQFLDFLPGLLSGLGFQGNYTYVDSKLPVVGQTVTVPADLLSKHSFNLTGIYEKGPLSLHVSYNRRSKSVQTNFADTAGRTLWNAPQESLDFSATYAFDEHFSIKFDAVNLSSAYQVQYYGTPDLPTLSNQLDRTYQLGFHVNF
ncbi:TonB-dependent receptor [Sphingomonas cannabina]|uniref:TonB-dependent receptor n=1 Tax=Sphingomonas cannabina TaxID=2899123 RepID=UPI001F2B935A|nr:TonB-dependent receptor [Sphingomonas cannabina]UIJ45323.1 TonB-dependent receptor [Sphingomonas cannabina]